VMSCGVNSIGRGQSLEITSYAEVQGSYKLIHGNVVCQHERCCNAAVGNGAMAVKNNTVFDLPLLPDLRLISPRASCTTVPSIKPASLQGLHFSHHRKEEHSVIGLRNSL
jgi:hypothetical protein